MERRRSCSARACPKSCAAQCARSLPGANLTAAELQGSAWPVYKALSAREYPVLSRIGIGRLPGDIMYQRGGTTFYFPIITCIIVSVLLSALFWLFNR